MVPGLRPSSLGKKKHIQKWHQTWGIANPVFYSIGGLFPNHLDSGFSFYSGLFVRFFKKQWPVWCTPIYTVTHRSLVKDPTMDSGTWKFDRSWVPQTPKLQASAPFNLAVNALTPLRCSQLFEVSRRVYIGPTYVYTINYTILHISYNKIYTSCMYMCI